MAIIAFFFFKEVDAQIEKLKNQYYVLIDNVEDDGVCVNIQFYGVSAIDFYNNKNLSIEENIEHYKSYFFF